MGDSSEVIAINNDDGDKNESVSPTSKKEVAATKVDSSEIIIIDEDNDSENEISSPTPSKEVGAKNENSSPIKVNFTEETLKAVRLKRKLWSKYLRKRTKVSWEAFAAARNKARSLTRHERMEALGLNTKPEKVVSTDDKESESKKNDEKDDKKDDEKDDTKDNEKDDKKDDKKNDTKDDDKNDKKDDKKKDIKKQVQSKRKFYEGKELTARLVFIPSVHKSITRKHIYGYFSQFGTLNDVDRSTRKSYATIIFNDVEAAVKVLEKKKHFIQGRWERVQKTSPEVERRIRMSQLRYRAKKRAEEMMTSHNGPTMREDMSKKQPQTGLGQMNRGMVESYHRQRGEMNYSGRQHHNDLREARFSGCGDLRSNNRVEESRDCAGFHKPMSEGRDMFYNRNNFMPDGERQRVDFRRVQKIVSEFQNMVDTDSDLWSCSDRRWDNGGRTSRLDNNRPNLVVSRQPYDTGRPLLDTPLNNEAFQNREPLDSGLNFDNSRVGYQRNLMVGSGEIGDESHNYRINRRWNQPKETKNDLFHESHSRFDEKSSANTGNLDRARTSIHKEETFTNTGRFASVDGNTPFHLEHSKRRDGQTPSFPEESQTWSARSAPNDNPPRRDYSYSNSAFRGPHWSRSSFNRNHFNQSRGMEGPHGTEDREPFYANRGQSSMFNNERFPYSGEF